MSDLHHPPARLRSALERVIRESSESPANLTAAVRSLKRTISDQPRSVIDYSIHSVSFLYLYYLANFHKASIVARRIDVPPTDRLEIVDLGMGSGAGIAGFVFGLSAGPKSPDSVHIHGVERSRRQLERFEELTDPFLRSVPIHVTTTFQERDIETVSPSLFEQHDLILDSFALAELPDAGIRSLRRRVDHLEDSPRIVLIEEADSEVFETFRMNPDTLSIFEGEFELPTPTLYDDPRLDEPIHHTGTFNYAIYQPTRTPILDRPRVSD